jgi:hypothetical protein
VIPLTEITYGPEIPPEAVDAIVRVFPEGVIVIFDPADNPTAPVRPFTEIT